MSKTRNRPASDRRPARRSLVELTAAASRAIDDGLLVAPVGPIAASPRDPPRSAPAANTHDSTLAAGRVTAPPPAAVPAALNAPAARKAELLDSDSSAEMLVKIAKDCHTKAFGDITLGLNVALAHAKDFAEPKVASEAALKGQ